MAEGSAKRVNIDPVNVLFQAKYTDTTVVKINIDA